MMISGAQLRFPEPISLFAGAAQQPMKAFYLVGMDDRLQRTPASFNLGSAPATENYKHVLGHH
jgi:hypothetical protein